MHSWYVTSAFESCCSVSDAFVRHVPKHCSTTLTFADAASSLGLYSMSSKSMSPALQDQCRLTFSFFRTRQHLDTKVFPFPEILFSLVDTQVATLRSQNAKIAKSRLAELQLRLLCRRRLSKPCRRPAHSCVNPRMDKSVQKYRLYSSHSGDRLGGPRGFSAAARQKIGLFPAEDLQILHFEGI